MRILSIVFVGLIIAACTNPGERHEANVYGAGAVNQRQEVKTVSIVSVIPAKVEVDNSENQKAAGIIGGLLGALLGNAVGANNGSGTGGAIAGGVAGSAIGDTAVKDRVLVDGVQIIYQEGSRVLSSAQIGRPCDYALGTALAIVTDANETRIQSNHDCVEGQEAVVGSFSKLGSLPVGIDASDQDSLDDLERERELLSKKREVQVQRTGLGKETRRTENAEESADLELDSERADVERQRAINQAIREGSRGY